MKRAPKLPYNEALRGLFFMQKDLENQASECFRKNQLIAQSSMGARYESLDWEVIKSRRDACRRSYNQDPFNIKPEDFLLLPPIMPANNKIAAHYADLNKDLELGKSINQYIDVHGRDPHLFGPLLKLRQAVINEGFDPDNRTTNIQGLRPYFLVVFATGDGDVLRKIINTFQPYHIVLALSDWHDFATSFWDLDWGEINNLQSSKGKISICRYENGREISAFLASQCLAGLDHALCYLPPESGCNPKAYEFRDEITQVSLNNAVTYLGYTIDEINMVWNTWKTLSYQPKVYSQPQRRLGGRMVVCGSGPSLDENIENLRELSRTHLITACGSNFRTLKSNGIRVDFLALVERADEVLSDVKQVVEESGAGETRLVMSTTCHHELQTMFGETMVYFRPALTPLALFSNSPDEILNFEGPESINAGVAIASAFGMDELVLVGVDLGARSLDKVRSAEAVGCVVRDLEFEEIGNFGSKVHTSRLLRDARTTVENCLLHFSALKAFNASDGVKIKGAETCVLSDRVAAFNNQPTLHDFDSTALGKWWISSQRYTPERFQASWQSRRPRAEIHSLISALSRLLLSSVYSWETNLIFHVTELLDLSGPPHAQFPRRMLRSTIHKLVIAVHRQLLVMGPKSKEARNFDLAAREILLDLLQVLEVELYALCDAVEALPVHTACDNELNSSGDNHG